MLPLPIVFSWRSNLSKLSLLVMANILPLSNALSSEFCNILCKMKWKFVGEKLLGEKWRNLVFFYITVTGLKFIL